MRLAPLFAAIALFAQNAGEFQRRGEDHFRQGRITEAIAAFDRAIALDQRLGPQNWQRGIALYYAARFEDGRKQFEIHQTVNPDDVENAAWRYICMARAGSLQEARETLLPIAGDRRVPMMQIYAMYQGKSRPADVLSAAGLDNGALFYAHLYIGLYQEAHGNSVEARRHIALAAGRYAQPHYMGDVARVHMRVRDWK